MRRRAAQKSPPPLPVVGAKVRALPDGRVMVREPNAPTRAREVPGHGRVLFREVTFSRDGRSWPGLEWDLSELLIPPGAVRADPMLQNFCCSGPKLWYEDIERRCVQCQEAFVFTASEQRFWYETLHFNEASTAIRCLRCRKRRRTVASLHAQLALALRATEQAPKDADRWLELARVSGELRALGGQGDLRRGIAAARKAWRLSGQRLPEALYWESVLQHFAGRDDKCRAAEDAFLAAAGPERRLRGLVRGIEDRRAGRDR